MATTNMNHGSLGSLLTLAVVSMLASCGQKPAADVTPSTRVAAAPKAYANGQELDWPTKTAGEVTVVAISDDGTLIAAGKNETPWSKGRIRVWNIETGHSVSDLATKYNDAVYSLAFLPKKHIVAIGDLSGVTTWDVSTQKKVRHYGRNDGERYMAVLPSPIEGEMAISGRENWIEIWDIESGKMKRGFEHSQFADSLSYSPDGKLLTSCAMNQKVRAWNASTGKLARELNKESYFEALSATFSPDGAQIAAAVSGAFSNNGTGNFKINIWNVKDWKLQSILSGHIGSIKAVRFSSDGSLLASAGEDATIKIWRFPQGTLAQTLKGHQGSINSLAFLKDKKMLVSGGADGTVRIWDLSQL